jgi:3'(2'), 5'-bisphosphate nucleotidase
MNSSYSTHEELSGYLKEVISIAGRAAGEIIKIYDTAFVVENKEDDSPLTAADLAANRVITAGLSQLAPDIPILSEESSTVPYATRSQWTRYWLVDPLDGTKEFIKRNGEFTVNIALIEKHAPIMGVVYLPVTGICYHALRGQGAWRVTPGNGAERLKTRAARAERISAAGSRSHGSERQVRFFQALGPDAQIVTAGSSLKFCLVAEGKVDIYPRFGPTSEWDTGAAQCVVEEAGGTVVNLEMRRLEYNHKESLLNPEFLVIGDPEFDWADVLARADVLQNSEE